VGRNLGIELAAVLVEPVIALNAVGEVGTACRGTRSRERAAHMQTSRSPSLARSRGVKCKLPASLRSWAIVFRNPFLASVLPWRVTRIIFAR
jgi:hypothetical protein